MSLFVSPQVIDKIHMKDVSFGFDQNALVNNFTCEIPTNKVVHIKGTRGIGKSCFLKLLAGLEMPISGSYIINGVDTSTLSFEEFLEFRILIGYSFDYGGLINNMSIKENLTLPLRYHNVADQWLVEERVDFYLKYFDLWEYRDQRPAFIPGSMRKEACVARSFVLEPEMVILDCPTIGMHKHNIGRLKELIDEKRTDGNLKHIYIAGEDESLEEYYETTFDLDEEFSRAHTSKMDEVVA